MSSSVVLRGFPPTRFFSGASSYPIETFLDPENEWECEIALAPAPATITIDELSLAPCDVHTLERRCAQLQYIEASDAPSDPGEAENAHVELYTSNESQRGAVTATEECSICLNHFSVRDRAARTPCLHTFHSSCLRSWLQLNTSCPACRRDVTSTAS